MRIILRHEIPEDYRTVEEITREAFWNLYFPGCDEHFVVHTLRNHPTFLPKLSFVIEYNGKLVGSIFYTKSQIVTPKGNIDTVTFGPVSIHPDFHRQGLGKELITHSIDAAKKAGHQAIMILGYPYHYEPYGFCGGKRYGIAMSDGNYYKGLQVLPLFEGALDGINGEASFSDVFDVNNEDVEKFDATFSLKEKKAVPSQKEFEIASQQLDI